jgi:hypothetical protein
MSFAFSGTGAAYYGSARYRTGLRMAAAIVGRTL